MGMRQTRERLGRWGAGALAGIMMVCLLPVQAFAQTEVQVANETNVQGIPYAQGFDTLKWPSIHSQAAVVMDMNTGVIVYGKHALDAHYPASITKIMTALLALQHGHLDDVLTASPNAVQQPPDKLYMVPGEQEKLEPLLYALLLNSANDAAVDIAEHYGGSVSNFAQMMNAEAVTLGLSHTNFVNPNGLPNPLHRTTAYDMAVIARAAMQNAEFRKIVQTKSYSWSGEKWHSKLSNLNRMLFYYPGCIGVKTGFTSVAHETLVVAATHGTDTYLAVLMDAPTDYVIRHDASQLLDYAFGHYQTQTLMRAGQVVGDVPGNSNLPLVANVPLMATVRKGQQLHFTTDLTYALPAHAVHADTPLGTLNVLGESGGSIASIPVSSPSPWTPPIGNAVRVRPIFAPLAVLSVLAVALIQGIAKKRRRKNDKTGLDGISP